MPQCPPASYAYDDYSIYLQSIDILSMGMLQIIVTPSLLAVKFAVILNSDTSGVLLTNVRASGAVVE